MTHSHFGRPLQFRPMLRDRCSVCPVSLQRYVLWQNGWMDQEVGTEVGLGPGDIVLDGDPTPPRKGAQQPPIFRPMSIVVKRSPISATAELLT